MAKVRLHYRALTSLRDWRMIKKERLSQKGMQRGDAKSLHLLSLLEEQQEALLKVIPKKRRARGENMRIKRARVARVHCFVRFGIMAFLNGLLFGADVLCLVSFRPIRGFMQRGQEAPLYILPAASFAAPKSNKS